ncbi:MAG: hypothetical protein HYY95_27620 [Candidatus Rokubacteria bacterium]|nr:hypothetical protein [Candidatus Rokubacteria bacterium]
MADTQITPGQGELFFGLDSRSRRPAAGALVATGLAASLILGTILTPATGALGLTGAAPGLDAATDTAVTPATGALSLSSAPPVLGLTLTPGRAGEGVTITSLEFVGGASELVVGTRHAPATGGLLLSGAAPSRILGTVLTPLVAPGPGPASLILDGAAPVVVASTRITPQAGSLSLMGTAPSVVIDLGIRPGTGALSFAAAAPILIGETTRTPLSGQLALAGSPPGLVIDHRLTPATGSIAAIGIAPAMGQDIRLTPPAGALTLSGVAPGLSTPTAITPATGALTLTGFAPSLPQEGILTPATGALSLQGAAPTVLQASFLTPQAGGVALSGAVPGAVQGTPVTPSAGSLSVSGLAPTLLTDTRITPSAAALVLAGSAGAVEISGQTTLTPGTGALVLTGPAPTVSQQILGFPNDITRLSIRATLDAPAAAWELETPDLSLMTGDDAATTVRLAMGFLDGSDVAQLVNQIEAGRVTGRSWAGARQGLSVRLRGLDAMDSLMRTQRAIRYVPTPPPAVLEAVAPVEGEPEVETKVGAWTARGIATDLLAGTGLALYWGIRDYTMHEEFSAVGSILSLFRQLVAPWDFAPLGVDIRAQASVIRITQRVLSPAATVTKTMAAARCDAVQGERRRHPLIGSVVLEGRLESSRLTQTVDDEGGIIWVGGDDEGNPDPNREPLTVRTAQETRDAFGTVTSRTERTERWRMPDRLLEYSVEKVFRLVPDSDGKLKFVQTNEQEIFITLDESIYGPRGPINQPLPRSSVTIVSTLVEQTSSTSGVSGTVKKLKETLREATDYTYDDQRFLRLQTTRVWQYAYALDGTQTITKAEEVTTTWRDELLGWIRVTEARTTFDRNWQPTGSSSRERLAAGYPPGGLRPPGKGPVIFFFPHDATGLADFADADLTPIRLTATLSDDPTAIPIRSSNRNLDAAGLAYQLALITACSGVYERPFRFAGPALPWLAVGDVLEITAYTPYAGAAPMSLGPALVRDLTMTYTRATAELRAEGEAVVYEAP